MYFCPPPLLFDLILSSCLLGKSALIWRADLANRFSWLLVKEISDPDNRCKKINVHTHKLYNDKVAITPQNHFSSTLSVHWINSPLDNWKCSKVPTRESWIGKRKWKVTEDEMKILLFLSLTPPHFHHHPELIHSIPSPSATFCFSQLTLCHPLPLSAPSPQSQVVFNWGGGRWEKDEPPSKPGCSLMEKNGRRVLW